MITIFMASIDHMQVKAVSSTHDHALSLSSRRPRGSVTAVVLHAEPADDSEEEESE